MACAPSLRDELSCSICLDIFTDPVTLRCGHNFCRVCIGQLLDKQQETRLYSCPECRMEFVERPALQRNINLFNIVEGFRPTQPDKNDTRVFCTYCVDSPEPAVRSCLLCEASLCDKHLRFHSKSPEHVLMDPSASLENRKCPVHKKILEYYCTQDSVCICVSCSLAGEHEGHKVELLDVASEKKKIELKGVLNSLTSEREETERRVLNLKDHTTKVRLETEVYINNFTVLIKEFREKLNTIEETVPNMISAQEKKLALSVSGFIKQLEMKKGELSTKISTLEELCSMSDPIMFFKHQLVCDSDQEPSREVVDDVHQVGDLDLALVSALLHTAIDKFTTEAVCSGFDIAHISPITLDVSTAGNDVAISEDLKMASWVGMGQCYLQTPERFQSCQVLSLNSFSSGKHYWEVGTSDLGDYCVGVCYAGIDRKGDQSIIGENDKSWGLRLWDNQYSAIHNTMVTPLPSRDTSRKLGLYLDYEAGQLSFYELQVPMRHLHTFTMTFTEPLHVLYWVMGSWVRFN